MRSPLSPSHQAMPGLTPAQPFLIPPFERFRFTLSFILATGLGWLLIWLVLRSIQDPLMPISAANQGLLSTFVVGFVSGIVVSATQWLALRRYVPDWLWILAGATGYVLLTITVEAWWRWIEQAMGLPEVVALADRLSPTAIGLISTTLRVGLTATCALWLGITQWLFLRQYTQSSSWWLGVPAIAVLLSSGFVALSAGLLSLGVRLPLEPSVLAAGVLGTTQAIALCLLQKRVNLAGRDSTSPLAIAPEILNYGTVQTLARQLQRRLNLAWTSEHLNDDSLTYLVGVTQTGAIAAYRPINSPAVEQLNQIPLPELADADAKHAETAEPLARFEVTFLPSGSLQVNAWRGVPLGWLAVSMLVAVTGLSAIVAAAIEWLK